MEAVSAAAAPAAVEAADGRGIVLPIGKPKAQTEAWRFLYAVRPRVASAKRDDRAAAHEPLD